MKYYDEININKHTNISTVTTRRCEDPVILNEDRYSLQNKELPFPKLQSSQ
jgi:hypothetical protein